MSKQVAIPQTDLDEHLTPLPNDTDNKLNCKPKYTPVEKLIYYRDKDMSLEEVGKQVGISKQAVHDAFLRHGIDTTPRPKYLKDSISGMLRWKISLLLNSLTVGEIKRIPPGQRAFILGLFIDKLHDKLPPEDDIVKYDAMRDEEVNAILEQRKREQKRLHIMAKIADLEHTTIDVTPEVT